jgi:hypothetical protein
MPTTKPKMDFTTCESGLQQTMEYHTMSLVELKQAARDHNPPIKQYYIKSRLELIRLLTLKELPESFILEKKKISDLRKEALAKGYKNIWKLRRAELMELLYPSSQQNHHDDQHAKKHDDPEGGKGK